MQKFILNKLPNNIVDLLDPKILRTLCILDTQIKQRLTDQS